MKNLEHIKGIVFDWAGTLVDYGCIAPTAVFVEVFKSFGIELSLKEAREPMGLAKKDHVRELLAIDHVQEQWQQKYGNKPGEEDVENIYSKLTPGLKAIVGNYSAAIPGVKYLLDELKEMGVKVGSTTGYVTEMMEGVIPAASKQGILPDSVVTSDETPAGRPMPFMVYQNALNLAVGPLHQMVKVGDTVADIKEGLNAGMWTVGYTKCGNEVGLTEAEVKALPADELNAKVEEASKKLSAAGAHFVVEGPWALMPVLRAIDRLIEDDQNPLA
ncbi:MAG: phosphonoacetaldehyde hydrolase [Carboxylicivirga sp.]|jgi:phosphonoacetaldehyde hydrolase|nr:phosphonoacetaldehyde hydrolase [Carboxylicivirga sp.]